MAGEKEGGGVSASLAAALPCSTPLSQSPVVTGTSGGEDARAEVHSRPACQTRAGAASREAAADSREPRADTRSSAARRREA